VVTSAWYSQAGAFLWRWRMLRANHPTRSGFRSYGLVEDNGAVMGWQLDKLCELKATGLDGLDGRLRPSSVRSLVRAAQPKLVSSRGR
jgi:hypothetical protein